MFLLGKYLYELTHKNIFDRFQFISILIILNFNLLHLQPWQPLPIVSWVLLTWVYKFLRAFLLSGISRISDLIGYVSCPIPGISHLKYNLVFMIKKNSNFFLSSLTLFLFWVFTLVYVFFHVLYHLLNVF